MQEEVVDWAKKCFSPEILNDKHERAKRVVEEALEVAQASGITASDCQDLIKYVFSRKIGEPSQEIAGLLVTTLVLAHTLNIDAFAALKTELERINQPEILEKIRKKTVSRDIAGISKTKNSVLG